MFEVYSRKRPRRRGAAAEGPSARKWTCGRGGGAAQGGGRRGAESGHTYSFWSSAVAAATMDGRDEGFDRRFLLGSSGWFSTEVSSANKLNMLTVPVPTT